MSRKEPVDPRDKNLQRKITGKTTKWDCYNLYPGYDWKLESTGDQNGTGRDLGDCYHYDDSEILRQQEEK